MQNFEYNFNVNGNYSSAIDNMSRATERQRLHGVVRRGFVAGRNKAEKSSWGVSARFVRFVRRAQIHVNGMAESGEQIERHDKETDANEHRYHLSQK